MTKHLEKALTLLQAGKPKQALSIVQKINRRNKQPMFDALQLEGYCCLKVRLWDKAKDMYQQALKLAKNNRELGNTHYNLAMVARDKKQYYQAITHMHKAMSLLPDDPDMLTWKYELANFYFETGSYVVAKSHLQPVLVSNQHKLLCAELMLRISEHLADYEQNTCYQQILIDHFDQLDAAKSIWLLNYIVRHGELDIQPYLAGAQCKGVNKHLLLLLKAQVSIKAGDKEKALTDIEQIDLVKLADADVIASYHDIKGKLLNDLGRYDEAFEQFALMNETNKQHLPAGWQPEYGLLHYEKAYLAFESQQTDFKVPIKLAFLVGCPRSGTTLLEQLVDTQSSILSLDEKSTIHAVTNKIVQDGYQYPACLASLDEDYVNELRRFYFQVAQDYIGTKSFSDHKLLLDKNPLLLLQLPLILRLFPDAKIILALRHPLDAILSCYMQNFVTDVRLGNFTGWQTSFQYYRMMFDSYHNFKTLLSWQEHKIKYEDLVDDMQGQMSSLMAFLQIEPDKQAFERFSQLSQKKIIRTPSNAQVKQGLYQGASGRWMNYLKYVQPHIPIVKGYINRFGYSLSPSR